jgi:glycosyltransferase involved in cell wall biosynthesis
MVGDNMKKALMIAHVASMIDLFNMDNIKILKSLGFEVDVACNFEKGSVTSKERVKQFRDELEKDGIRAYHTPIPRNIFSIKDIAASIRQIQDLVREEHYAIVHCQSPIGGVIARLACKNARKSGAKVIYIAHGFHFYQGAPFLNWLLYYPIERFCAKITDCIITINKEDYSLAKRKFYKTKRIEYIPGVGIDLHRIDRIDIDKEEKRKELKIPVQSLVLTSIGEVNNNKNHEVIIRAIAELKHDNIVYLICGQGELIAYLQNLAHQLKVENKVKFLGYREDVIQILKASDLFVFPSIREGLSVSLMEAMACGLPVVCSDIRGNRDLIINGEGGYLVDCHHAEGFSKAIQSLLNHSEIRDKMKAHNLAAIKDKDINRVNALMERIYRNVIEANAL